MRHRRFEELYPTLVRAMGLAMVPVLMVGTFLGYGYELAPAWIPVAGMILYKSVHDKAANNDQ